MEEEEDHPSRKYQKHSTIFTHLSCGSEFVVSFLPLIFFIFLFEPAVGRSLRMLRVLLVRSCFFSPGWGEIGWFFFYVTHRTLKKNRGIPPMAVRGPYKKKHIAREFVFNTLKRKNALSITRVPCSYHLTLGRYLPFSFFFPGYIP